MKSTKTLQKSKEEIPLRNNHPKEKRDRAFSFFKIIDQINHFFAILAGIALLAMAGLVVLNVILRNFSTPISGTFEVTGWLTALTAFFSLGYAQLHRGHVFINLLVGKLQLLLQKVIHTMVNLVSVVFFLYLSFQVVIYGLTLKNQGVVSATLQVPFYPLIIISSTGFICLCLAIIKETINIWREEEWNK